MGKFFKTAGGTASEYGGAGFSDVRDLKSDMSSYVRHKKQVAKQQPKLDTPKEALTAGAIVGSGPGSIVGAFAKSRGSALRGAAKGAVIGGGIGALVSNLTRNKRFKNWKKDNEKAKHFMSLTQAHKNRLAKEHAMSDARYDLKAGYMDDKQMKRYVQGYPIKLNY